MSAKNGKSEIEPPKTERLARAQETASNELIFLLTEHGVIGKAIARMIANLDAATCYFDRQNKEMVEIGDGATQVKAAMGLLAYAVGEPTKRSLVLHGQMPEQIVNRAELRELIDKKIAAMVGRADVTMPELVAAAKALAEVEDAATPSKLTPLERETEVKRILGVE